MNMIRHPFNKRVGFVSCLLLAAISFQSIAKVLISLKPGTYVEVQFACDDPPNAAIIPFDGRSFGDTHGEDCRTTVVKQRGKTLDMSTRCSVPGSAGASRYSSTMELQLMPDDAFIITSKENHPMASGALSYRLCPALNLKR